MKSKLGTIIILTMVLALAAPAAAQAPAKGGGPPAERVKTLLSKAQMLQYKGEHDKAIALYRVAATQAPGDLGTTLLLSGALLQQDRAKQARQAWDLWMKHTRQKDRLKVAAEHLLVRLMRDGKNRQVETVCDAWLLELEEKDRFAVLGDVYWKVGDRVQAVQLYTRQLAMAPSSSQLARRVEGWSLGAGLPRVAMESLRLYLRHQPSDLQMTRRLVKMQVKHKRAADVEGTWKLWLGATEMGTAHAVVGAYYRKAGQQDRAVEHYTRHLQRDPADMEVIRYLAGVWEAAGKKDRVAKMYLDAVKARSRTSVVQEASRALQALGRLDSAEQAWLLWHDKTSNGGRDLMVARFYLKVGKKDRALEYLRKAVAGVPRDPIAVKLLAEQLFAAKKRAEARKVLTSYLAVSTMRGSLAMVARIYLGGGDVRKAKKYYLQHMRKSPADRHSLRAFSQELAKKSQWKAARELWAEYCRHPRYNSRHEHAGDFFRSVNRRREAIAHYTKHLAIEPGDTWVVRALAKLHALSGRKAAAAKVWQRYLASSTDSSRFKRAAQYFLKAGQSDRAVKLYKRHLQHNPQSLRAHRMVARALVQAGKIKPAVALWESAVQSLSDRNRFEAAGDFFRSLGRAKRSLAMYRLHLQTNPTAARAHKALARALRQAGKLKEAETLWDKAVKTLSDNQRYAMAGEFFRQIQRWDRAAAMYAKNLKLNPTRRDAYRWLAEALHRSGKTSEAVALWERGVRLLTDRYRYERAGDFFKSAGLMDRALVMYRKHYKLHGSRWSCRKLTRELHRAGKVAEAVAVWEKAVVTLTDRNRYDAAGDFMREIGRPDRALVMYRKQLAMAPGSVSSHQSLAKALAEVGKVAEAVTVWDNALRTLTGNNRLQRAGDFFRSIGKPGRAIPLYQQYLKGSPSSSWVRRSLAWALMQDGRTGEAITMWQKSLRALPSTSNFSTAAAFFSTAGRLDLAIQAIRERLKLSPGDLSAHDNLARYLLQAGKGKQATALWENAARKLNARHRYRRAGHFFRRIGRWDRAAAMYRKHLALESGDNLTLSYLTRTLVRLGKTKEAVALWDKAVRSGSGRYRHDKAGEFFELIGRQDRAVAMYRKHLALAPSSLAAYRSLARALKETGKIKEATAVWDKAVRVPSDRYRHNRAAEYFKKIGRNDRAAALYRKHLLLVPTNSGAMRALARVLVSSGKVKEASALWDKAVKTRSDRYLYKNAGTYFQSIGRPKRALAMLRRYHALNPSSRWALEALANQMARMGRDAEAKAAWGAGLKVCNERNRFLSAGRLHHRLGNFDRAVKLMRRHLRTNPANAWAHEYLADALVSAGKTAEAEKVWQRWMGTGPNNRLQTVAGFYARIGKSDRALPLYRKYLAQEPANAHAHGKLASALWSAGKTAEADKVWAQGLRLSMQVYRKEFAADYFRRTGRGARSIPLYQDYLKSRPADEGAQQSLAQALIMAGRVKEAEAALLRAAPARGPNFRLGALGLFYARTGRMGKAIGLLEKYVAAVPGEANSIRYLAGVYLAAGKKARAEALWRQGLKRCAPCTGVAAEFYASIGRCEVAVPLFRKALAGDHRNVALHSQLAHCLAARGKAAEAQKERATASALARLGERHAPTGYWTYRGTNHSLAGALNSAAWLYLTHDSFNKKQQHALALARRAVKLSPFNKHVLGTLVFALCRNGHGAEALRLVKLRVARNPLSAWPHMEKALAHHTLGQRDLAAHHLKRSRELHLVPDADLAREQKKLAAALQSKTTP